MAQPRPKWREEWDRLTADPATGKPFKYLAIKGWKEWQSDYSTEWCKDWYGKDEDPDYNGKPVLQRFMMDRFRRLRGQMRQNLYNDPVGLVSKLVLKHGGELSEGCQIIVRLVSERFFIPTNEQDRITKTVEKSREEKGRGEQSTVKPPPVPAPQETPTPVTSDEPVRCKHGDAFPKHCELCKAERGPAPQRKIGFDPLNFREAVDIGGGEILTPDEVHRVVYYHWKVNTHDHWRTRSPKFFKQNMKDMALEMPAGFQIPMVSAPDKTCPKCNGSGDEDYQVKENGISYDMCRPCSCVVMVEK